MLAFDRDNFARWLPWFAMACVVVVLLLRIVSPSDIHDQTQPKTVGYTTNIVLNSGSFENWVLPLEVDEFPTTKPPFYNWVAAPFVALTDGRYEWAHKVPSIFAFLVLNLTVFFLLKRIDGGARTRMSWYWGVVIFCSNYMWFKLSYLARPDSLLTVFLVMGWIAATMLVHRQDDAGRWRGGRRRIWAAVFWGSTGMALIAKGPAAVLLPLILYGLLWCWNYQPIDGSQRPVRGRLRLAYLGGCVKAAIRISYAWVGFPLALVPFGIWFYLAYQINPEHVYEVLIREEVIDRMLGIGAEGTKNGPWDFLRTLPNMPLIFVTRFFPWSIFFIVGMVELLRRGQRLTGWIAGDADRVDELPVETRLWLVACLVGTIVPIVVFTLSAGKRGDYIALSIFPASVFVAWALCHLGAQWGERRSGLVAGLAGVMLVSFGVYAYQFDLPVRYALGDALIAFAKEVRPMLEDDDDQRAVELYRTGRNPLQTLLHQSRLSDPAMAAAAMEAGEPFWLLVRARDLEQLRAEPWAAAGEFVQVARSEAAASDQTAMIFEVVLYSVVPRVAAGG